MSKLPPRRLTAADVQHAYRISRGTLDGLVAKGYLVPERINGRGKRFFRPEQVEALFSTPKPQQTTFDLKARMDEVYVRVFGHLPRSRQKHLH